MLKIDFTNEIVFSFNGPNLCFLGEESDFLKLAKAISELSGSNDLSIDILKLDFVSNIGDKIQILFSSKKDARLFGVFDKENNLVFELDHRFWDRIFKYFILMSWGKSTYYLNSNENCLFDLNLVQDCNFICSSEF